MKKTKIAAIIFAVGFIVVPTMIGHAFTPGQNFFLFSNPNIMIDYVEPQDPIHYDVDINDPSTSSRLKEQYEEASEQFVKLKAVRERLKKSQLLERYSQFLVALRLPTTLRLRTKQCDQQNAWFDVTDTSINLCYEYVLALEAKAPKATTKEGFTPEGTLTGMIVSTMLHESGHAMFAIYNVPILGREEDAADQIAGFVMMQFGTDVALTTMKVQHGNGMPMTGRARSTMTFTRHRRHVFIIFYVWLMEVIQAPFSNSSILAGCRDRGQVIAQTSISKQSSPSTRRFSRT